MTVDEIFAIYCDETGQSSSDATVKAKFKRMILRTSRTIQPFAGVEKTWSVAIVVDTETYTSATTSMTDYYRAHEGRFLPTGTTDLLGNYSLVKVLKELDWAGSGFWLNGAKTLYMRPKPAVAGTLKIYGEKVLSNLNFAADVVAGEVSTPEIDAEYHDIYWLDAARRFGAQDEDTETAGARYNVYTGEYERLETEMRRRYMEKEDDRRINRVS